MRAARGVARLVSLLLISLSLSAGSAQAGSLSPGSSGKGAPDSGSDMGGAKKKARKPSSKKVAPKSKASPGTKLTHDTPAHPARQKAGHAQAGKTINEDVTLTPFPSHAGAAKKALAQNRRDQLDDAEKAARSPTQADRWQTVLFHLRDLDARADSEGCFWRLVAYYRLGQLDRARTLRQSCELAPKDSGVVEAEDEQAAHLQTAATLAEKEPAAAVGNPGPYDGAAPAKLDR
jgi:hypothetical protein